MPAGPGTPSILARFPGAGRVLMAGCIALAAALLTQQLRHVEWAAVGTSLRAFTPAALAVAFALAATSHALYACYELIGRHLTHHRVPPGRTLTIGVVSYAFNLNFGMLIGGFATRYRLYTNEGLGIAQVTQVIGVSVVTNWVGYASLAGTLLTLRPPALPAGWVLDAAQLRWLGLLMAAAATSYLAACVLAPNRRWQWREHALVTPSARIALLQLALSALNWLTIATLVWWVLGRQVDFVSVASVFLLAAVAGIVVRVPAGLGVLEAVFLALLSHRLRSEQLLAGLIVHRVVYYLAPLAVASVLLVRLERDRRRRAIEAPRHAGESTPRGSRREA